MSRLRQATPLKIHQPTDKNIWLNMSSDDEEDMITNFTNKLKQHVRTLRVAELKYITEKETVIIKYN